MALVKKSRKAVFDPKIFLAMVGDGKTISKYQKDQIVFSQGDVADAVFYTRTLQEWWTARMRTMTSFAADAHDCIMCLGAHGRAAQLDVRSSGHFAEFS